jgi:protein-S-isoprenylcysteine O-methyltransferase Ste14
MEHALPVIIVVVMLATLGVLGLGLLNLARGGSGRSSNKLMQWRVLLQGLALLLFLIFMWLFRH